MRDFLGNEFVDGDKVVYVYGEHREFNIGDVSIKGKYMVEVNGMQLFPTQVIKLDACKHITRDGCCE